MSQTILKNNFVTDFFLIFILHYYNEFIIRILLLHL